MAKVDESTMFGGKPYPSWQEQDFALPGYSNAKICFKNISSGREDYWGFLVSPSSLSVQQQNDLSTNKTMAGWFIGKNGPGLGNLTMSGYLLDTLRAPERLRFLDMYREYAEDDQNKFHEFVSNYSQKILLEGKFYHGIIQSINYTKNANQPFMYQYTINFIFYKTTSAYSFNSSVSMSKDAMMKQMGVSGSNNTQVPTSGTSSIDMSDGVMNILNGTYKS